MALLGVIAAICGEDVVWSRHMHGCYGMASTCASTTSLPHLPPTPIAVAMAPRAMTAAQRRREFLQLKQTDAYVQVPGVAWHFSGRRLAVPQALLPPGSRHTSLAAAEWQLVLEKAHDLVESYTRWWDVMLGLPPFDVFTDSQPKPDWDAFYSGLVPTIALTPNKFASNGDPLHTQCIMLTSYTKYVKEEGCPFKLHPHGPHSHSRNSPNRGYFRIKASSTFLPDLVTRDFGLHTLLCHLYHGPPADPSFECSHICQHKLCICPWHLKWEAHQANTSSYYAHRKKPRTSA